MWGTSRIRNWRIKAISRRDGFYCWLCHEGFHPGDDKGRATIDHAIPKARGGGNELANLRLAHEKCNGERGMIVETKPSAARCRLQSMALERI